MKQLYHSFKGQKGETPPHLLWLRACLYSLEFNQSKKRGQESPDSLNFLSELKGVINEIFCSFYNKIVAITKIYIRAKIFGNFYHLSRPNIISQNKILFGNCFLIWDFSLTRYLASATFNSVPPGIDTASY